MADLKTDPKPIEPIKSAKEKDLEAKLAASEADKAKIKLEAEEKALERITAAVGITPDSLKAIEADKQSDDQMGYDLGELVVKINGFPFSGKGQAPRSVVEVLMSLAGNQKMARLREMMSNDGQVNLISSQISSHMIPKKEG